MNHQKGELAAISAGKRKDGYRRCGYYLHFDAFRLSPLTGWPIHALVTSLVTTVWSPD